MIRIFLILALLATPAWSVQPDEILDDPVLEARARVLSKGLRCLVCRNQNIDESNAGLARDLRLLVRERLVAGDSNDEVMTYLVDRYGEFVLLKPTSGGANLLLWYAGPAIFLSAIAVGGFYIRRRGQGAEPEDLSDQENARLNEILNG